MIYLNSARNTIYNLYQKDPLDEARFGDNLIEGMRDISLIYDFFVNEPFNPNHYKVYEISLRVAALAIAVFIGISAIFLALTGIILKALQKAPVQKEQKTSKFFEKMIESRQFKENNNSTEGAIVISYSPNFLLDPTQVPQEIWDRIFTFVPPNLYGSAMTISKAFEQILQARSLWHSFIVNNRLWGASHWCYKCPDDQNHRLEMANDNTYKQIVAYHDLYKTGLTEKENPYLNYLVRLKQGGPLAFKQIPLVTISNCRGLKLDEMKSAIMRTESSDHQGLAICVKDQTMNNPTVLNLIFKKGKKENTTFFYPKQEKNEYWPAKSLILENQAHLNYILAIINQEDLNLREDFIAPLLKKTIQLYHPS